MNPDTVAFIATPLTFVSGLAGLFYQAWRPKNEDPDETRDLINRTTGLVATLAALVLGLLIASANNFYNTQKTGLELVSARALQLDELLRRYGPEAQPAHGLLLDLLKSMVTGGDEQVGQSGGVALKMPTIAATEAQIDTIFGLLNGLQPTASELQKSMLGRAREIVQSIGDQRLLMNLQLSESLSWPVLTILISWTSLLFFGFGMLARTNVTTVAVLAVGAFSVGSAIFLIVELSTPYNGMLRLSPAAVLTAIETI
jgi:hypothetical protein